ncbi:alpha/beta fold hydrolase [Chitinophaga rhizophila]|uniref:Alpha/beta hydrolase n=1 Tax=Chitinophaga rhizophila TaxID=2866212 RepID=A0ABS7G5Z4_9BACT|nr:alpha/beta hydrolase [Chitinophaga rhizophila]MBW8683065.1 alpha/beta hydrolase [Chitinophaga rhizophila]
MKKQLLLLVLLLSMGQTKAQEIVYGNNQAAGKYLVHDGAKLYYETYGEGQPLLLLHGDLYGYITEFSAYIPLLSKQYKVIAVGTRGHGRSELGDRPLTYQLLAEDALAILRKETTDSAIIMGFSGGAVLSYYIAAHYPTAAKKVVALAGALNAKAYKPSSLKELREMNDKIATEQLPKVVAARKAIMPQPERYGELIEQLKKLWFQDVYVTEAQAKNIKCPVLTVGGDRDEYFTPAAFVATYNAIPGSSLAIVPGAGHVKVIRAPDYLTTVILPFMNQK